MMTVTGLVGGSLMSKSSLLDHISLMDYLTGGGGSSLGGWIGFAI